MYQCDVCKFIAESLRHALVFDGQGCGQRADFALIRLVDNAAHIFAHLRTQRRSRARAYIVKV